MVNRSGRSLLRWTPKNQTMALVGGGVRGMSAQTCRRVNRGAIKRGRRHALIFGAAEEADNQSVEDLRRGDDRRHARFLRFSPDRVRSGVHRKGLEPYLWGVGGDPAGLRHQRAARLAVLWLAGRQDRPAQGHAHYHPELFDPNAVDAPAPRAWIGVSR